MKLSFSSLTVAGLVTASKADTDTLPSPEEVVFFKFKGNYQPFEGVKALGNGSTNTAIEFLGPKKTGSSGKDPY